MVLRRIFAAFYDFIVYFMLPIIIAIVMDSFIDFSSELHGAWVIIIILSIALLWFRDFITGRSLGKKIFAFKIMRKDNHEVNRGQLFLRNLTLPIGIIEVILILLNEDRLGDRFNKTSVIETSSKISKQLMYLISCGTILLILVSLAVIAALFGTVTYVP